MPIIISEKEINWSETEEKIVIILRFSSRVDVKPSVLITSKYLKVSSPPYLWECFLLSSIDPEHSITRIGTDCVSLELNKCVHELWNGLVYPQAECKSYRNELREAALKENEKFLENSLQLKCKKRQEVLKESVHKQMELDDCERKLIEKRKEVENQRAAAEIQRKKEQFEANMIAQKRKHLLQMARQIPSTRKGGHISISFTPRVFPSAARESQENEEKEWLEKQHAASERLQLEFSDLSPDEQNPEWLKSKAESMVKMEDFRSAVNAYSLAIRMCPLQYSLYLGRSVCHLNLGNLHKAIEDSSKALELLLPAVAENASDRKKAHETRGEAFYRLKLPVEGLMDLEASLKIDKNDEELKEKVANWRLEVESSL